MAAFTHVFRPLHIGPVEVPNRIFLAPHATNFADPLPNQRLTRYYLERARGGVGLIIHEAVPVHPTGYSRGRGTIHAWSPDVVPAYRRMADALHAEGTPIFCQILHPGRQMRGSRQPPWAPSPIPCPLNRDVPHGMTHAEVKEMVRSFAVAAAHCQAGGFDGVEIHAANGYLIQQFLSPVSNQREDEYGGSPANRLRFLREVIAAVRQEVGRDYVVGIRISGDEMVPGGLTLADMTDIMAQLEAEGQLDYVSVSIGNYSVASLMVPDMFYPAGTFVQLGAALKLGGLGLPVLIAGKIKDAGHAEGILETGQADMVGMARALIADPYLVQKARAGRSDEIRPCLSCNQECLDRIGRGGMLSCTVNPAVGREEELGEGTLAPAGQKKKVVVAGGGVGGMECALTAARRGHRVILFEAAPALGGQTRFAAVVPSRAEFGHIAEHLAAQVEAVGIEVRLGCPATAETVLAEEPDAVVVATGARPRLPDLPGVAAAVTIWDVLQGRVQPGPRVVVVDSGDGGWPFCSTLDYLSEKGCQVEAVTSRNYVGAGISALSISSLYPRLLKRGVTLTPLHTLEAIRERSVVLRQVHSGFTRTIEDVDTVVLSTDNVAEDSLAQALQGRVPELHCIGDAMAPRRASHAIHEGHLLGRRL